MGNRRLAIRLTNKYVGSYRHMDDWETVGEYTVLGSTELFDPASDCGDYGKDYLVVRVESEASEEDIMKALRHSLTSEGCSCEHDCCGCRSDSVVSVTRVGTSPNIWIVEVSWHLNL